MWSQSERDYIRQGCFADCRSDGRSIHQYRPTYSITTGVLPLSHGSSRLLDSGEDAIHYVCSVKAELVQPSIQHPDHGTIEISILESQSSGGGNHTKLVSMRQAQAALQQRVPWFNLEQLCVIPSVAVWKLSVDVWLISSVVCLDSASHCIAAALADTVLPSVQVTERSTNTSAPSTSASSALDHLVIDSDIAHAKPLVVSRLEIPRIVTVHLVSQTSSIPSVSITESTTPMTTRNNNGSTSTILLLDATRAEQSITSCAVHVVVRPPVSGAATSPVVLSVWKTGSGSIPFTLLPDCVSTAVTALPLALQHYPHASDGWSDDATHHPAQTRREPLFQPSLIIQS